MIKTLYDIGKILIEKEPDWFMPWQDPYPGQEFIVLVAEIEDLYFNGNLIPEISKRKNLKRYLYKKFTKDANIVPTFRVTDGKKTFDRYVNCIEKYHSRKFGFQSIQKTKLKKAIIERYLPLKEKLENYEFRNNKNYLLTIKFNDNWLGEDEYFFDFFQKDHLRSYFNKNYSGEVQSISDNKFCAVTEEQNTVYGFVDTLGFTVDSISFMRNGFDQSNAYKMFPVSEQAVIVLEGVKNLLFNTISRNFLQSRKNNLKYLLVPHFININRKIQNEILEYYLLLSTKKQNHSTPGDESKSIFGNEEIVHEIIQTELLCNAGIYYDVFFYQKNKNQTLIKLHLSDILPSQFSRIFKVKNQIENRYDIITRWENKQKDGFDHYYINFFNIKDFFSTIRNKEPHLYPFFFKVVEAIFYNSRLNEELVIKYFLEKVVGLFKNRNEKGNWYSSTYKRSFIIYQFFNQLGLFTNKNNNIMEDKTFVALTMDEFIEQHKSLLNSNYAEGIFMLGCLVKKLLNIQYANLKSTPFNKRLNNLIVDNKEVQRIFRETKSKLTDYRVSYPILEAKIFNALSDQNETAKLTRDKMSYLFSGGLVMEDEFKKELERRKKMKENPKK